MHNDPIVEEVHRTREQLAAEFGYDIYAIFADLRKRQCGLGDRLVTRERGTEIRSGTVDEASETVVGSQGVN